MKIEFLDEELTRARLTTTTGFWWWKRSMYALVERLPSLLTTPVHTYWKYTRSGKPTATSIHRALEDERERLASEPEHDWHPVRDLPRARLERG